MASGIDLLADYPPVRQLLVGYPGTGKTGSLVPLLNAGFKIRVIDFDGNIDPVLRFADPAMLGNLDVVQLKGMDKTKIGSQVVEADGIPMAFPTAFKLMNRWTYTNKRGEVIDLGNPEKDWGPDTILVLDSLTAMGEAAMLRALKMRNRTYADTTDGIYGTAMGEQERFIKAITSSVNRFHVIVFAHLRMIGPKDFRKGESEIQVEIKKAVAEMITTRLYPSALGWQLPQVIAKEFPTVLLAEKRTRNKKVKRYLTDVAGDEIDLKFPGPPLPEDLPIETGQLKVFELLSPGSLELVRNSGKEETVK